MSAQIAEDALDTLRSPEYLPAWAGDLGEDPEQFVAAVEAIAAAANTSSLPTGCGAPCLLGGSSREGRKAGAGPRAEGRTV